MDWTSLPPVVRREMVKRALEWVYQPGEILIVQDGQPHCLTSIVQGEVEVGIREKSGRVHVLAHRSGGSIIGEMSLLMGIPCTAQVRAMTRVSARLLPIGDYYDLTQKYQAIETTLVQLALGRLAESSKDRFAARRYADVVWKAALAAHGSGLYTVRELMFLRWGGERNR